MGSRPWLVLAATKIAARFALAVDYSVEVNHQVRERAECEVYARPMHLMQHTYQVRSKTDAAITNIIRAEGTKYSRVIFLKLLIPILKRTREHCRVPTKIQHAKTKTHVWRASNAHLMLISKRRSRRHLRN